MWNVFALALLALLGVAPVHAGTIYVDCDNGVTCAGNNGASATNSGSTDTSSPTVTGSAAAWTTSTGGVVGAQVNGAGTGYGTSLSGTLTWSGAGCSVNPVLNATSNAAGNINSITSINTAGTCTTFPSASATTWTAGGGLSAGSSFTAVLQMNQAVTLDTNTDLSAIVSTPGPTQSSIRLANATNTNQTIFWVNGVTGCTGVGACSITVSQLVSCSSCSGSAWTIGGRYLWPSGSTVPTVSSAIGFSGAKDELVFNTSPSTRTSAYFAAPVAGTSGNGWNVIRGKTGVRPKLDVTAGSAVPINLGNFTNWKVENLEVAVSGAATASPVMGTTAGANNWFNNILISDGPNIGFDIAGTNARITNSEVTGVTGTGILIGSASNTEGNYIHGNGGDGVTVTIVGAIAQVTGNAIIGNSGRGVYLSSPSVVNQNAMFYVLGNTIVDNTLAGIQVADPDAPIYIQNNIIKNANSADIVSLGSERWAIHGYNVFYSSGGGVLNGLTANATEFTADPLFVNAGAGNYALQNASPGAGTGTPGTMLGLSTTVGFRDIGAFQRAVGAGGGATGNLRPGIN